MYIWPQHPVLFSFDTHLFHFQDFLWPVKQHKELFCSFFSKYQGNVKKLQIHILRI